MKKTATFIMAIAMCFAISCSSTPEEKAAKAACQCFDPIMDWADDNEDLFSSSGEPDLSQLGKMMEIFQPLGEATACMVEKSQEVNEIEKMDADKLEAAMKKQCPKTFKMLEAFEKMGQ